MNGESLSIWVMLFYRLATASTLVGLIVGIWFYRSLLPDLKLLLLLLGASIAVEVIAFFFSARLNESNLFIFNIYTIVEFGSLMLIFMMWQKNKRLKKVYLLSLVVFMVFWFQTIASEKDAGFDSVALTVESIILVAVGVISLIDMMADYTSFIVDNPRFWVTAGVLMYFAGNIIVFAFGNQVLQVIDYKSTSIWAFHTFLNIVFNLCFVYAFVRQRRIWKSAQSTVIS